MSGSSPDYYADMNTYGTGLIGDRYTYQTGTFNEIIPTRGIPASAFKGPDHTAWKFHLAVKSEDVPKAWNIVVDELVESGGYNAAKVATPESIRSFAASPDLGPMITLYSSPEKSSAEQMELLRRIEDRLSQAGIKGSKALSGDRAIPGSAFLSYRNDSDIQGNYIARKELKGAAPAQRYNPSGFHDPYETFKMGGPATIETVPLPKLKFDLKSGAPTQTSQGSGITGGMTTVAAPQRPLNTKQAFAIQVANTPVTAKPTPPPWKPLIKTKVPPRGVVAEEALLNKYAAVPKMLEAAQMTEKFNLMQKVLKIGGPIIGKTMRVAAPLTVGVAIYGLNEKAEAAVLNGKLSGEALQEYRTKILTVHSAQSLLPDPTMLTEAVTNSAFDTFAGKYKLDKETAEALRPESMLHDMSADTVKFCKFYSSLPLVPSQDLPPAIHEMAELRQHITAATYDKWKNGGYELNKSLFAMGPEQAQQNDQLHEIQQKFDERYQAHLKDGSIDAWLDQDHPATPSPAVVTLAKLSP